ncbi:MAG: MerC family mercury resistance protein [Myxococcales bacterium]|nr:MerC family mercury resistance protein [Myxococcales bacterium]
MRTTTRRYEHSFLGLPASALAALPLCPTCYPAYAGILSALGLGVLEDVMIQTYITVLFLAVALGALLYRAKSRRGYGPFALGASATLVVLFAKLVMGSDPIIYAGVGVLVIAGVWNVWPRANAACEIGSN